MGCCVSVPATSANLGVGYDCLGVALDIRATFNFETAHKLEIVGCETRFCGADNLVWQSYLATCREFGFAEIPLRITIDSQIPNSGGLGSSATCVVAGVAAAQLVHTHAIDIPHTLNLACALEGHPDNVAPAILGGLVNAFVKDGDVCALHFPVHECLRFVVIAPPSEVLTEHARRSMPETISVETAVWQMGRCTAVVEALRTGNVWLLGRACDDRLHEPYRRHLIDCYDEVRTLVHDSGISTLYISGSGAAMCAVCDSDNKATALACTLARALPDAWIHVLNASETGLLVLEP